MRCGTARTDLAFAVRAADGESYKQLPLMLGASLDRCRDILYNDSTWENFRNPYATEQGRKVEILN